MICKGLPFIYEYWATHPRYCTMKCPPGFGFLGIKRFRKEVILHSEIQPVCVSVCVSVWSNLTNYVYYDDETFTGDWV